MVKKVTAKDVAIAKENVKFPLAFVSADYSGVDESTAAGLRQYIIDVQDQNTP